MKWLLALLIIVASTQVIAVPEITNGKMVRLEGLDLEYGMPENVKFQETAPFELMATWTGTITQRVTIIVSVDGVELQAKELPANETFNDEGENHWLYHTYAIPTNSFGVHKIELTIDYGDVHEIITESYTVQESFSSIGLITDATLALPVIGEVISTGLWEGLSEAELQRQMTLAQENLIIYKRLVPGNGGTRYEFIIAAKGNIIAKDVRVIEEVPKSVAESATQLRFVTTPTIVKDDPMLMWHFEEVADEVDLTYETDREVEMTGNTIVTVAEVVELGTPYHIILPMIIIPVIVLFVLILPHLHRRE